PRRRVVGAGAHVLVAEAERLEVLGLAAGRGVEPDGARDLRVDDPEVALRRRLDARCAIPQLGRRVPYPQVLRRIHVRVGRDQALLGHGLPPDRDVYAIAALSTP